MARKTLLFRLYSGVARIILPLVARIEERKVLNAGFSVERAREKRGYASQPRPDGTLIWCHAASVGESLSVLTLISRLGDALPDAVFLITSGTPSSADLIARRMPPRTCHQFAPLDAPAPVSRFMAYWRPDAGIFVESELWPQLITQAHGAGTPLALVNARLSDRALAGWRKRPDTSAMVLSCFRLILTQTEALATALTDLGADHRHVRQAVNLKSLSVPLPVDADLVASARTALADRPVWIAASTHPGEEEIVLEAHTRLLRSHPELCLILVPRHPTRGDEVAKLITARGWPVSRRSTGDVPHGPVYLADTLGELGSWYALTNMVFLGGSLLPVGGHNPYEVAHAGAAIVSGPHVFNFADTFAALHKMNAAATVKDARALADQIATWLSDPQKCSADEKAAQGALAQQSHQLDAVMQDLITALDLKVARRG